MSTKERYVLVDALRGVAAIAVVLHHLSNNSILTATLAETFPSLLQEVCKFGALGVEVFFVLSGFVVAHSLSSNALTLQSIGNFIIRRQLRLDPPYWIVMSFALFQWKLESLVPSLVTARFPNIKSILLNIFYLQDLLGQTRILDVSWTLCIEIQFYLVFSAILFIGRQQRTSNCDSSLTPVSLILVFAGGLFSLIYSKLSNNPSHSGAWFYDYWQYFAAGVLTYAVLKHNFPYKYFGGYLLFFSIVMLYPFFSGIMVRSAATVPAMLVGLLTTLILFAAGRKDRLACWGKNAILQYFGRISYSLYLVHLPVLLIIMRGGYKLTGTNKMAAVGWFVVSAIVSTGVAHMFFNLVEKPSMKLASRLKRVEVAPPVSGETVPTCL